MLTLRHASSRTKLLTLHLQSGQSRSLWGWVNMMFNKPDHERIAQVGPDRACAEWVLRNGGRIIWSDGSNTADYNTLPPEDVKVPGVAEIDGSNSSISHYGFPHLYGCKYLHKIVLDNSSYIENRAMKGLGHGKNSLTYVHISNCPDVSDSGIKEIQVLTKLETLILQSLSGVSDLNECKQYLQSKLPSCKIQFKMGYNEIKEIPASKS